MIIVNIIKVPIIYNDVLLGREIDAVARRALWDVGLDYRHGTGHGIGAYLSVHEGRFKVQAIIRQLASPYKKKTETFRELLDLFRTSLLDLHEFKIFKLEFKRKQLAP